MTGLSYEAAKSRLENAGFFMRAAGVSTYYTNTTTADSQSIAGGETAAIGTVVVMQFFNVVEDGAVARGIAAPGTFPAHRVPLLGNSALLR